MQKDTDHILQISLFHIYLRFSIGMLLYNKKQIRNKGSIKLYTLLSTFSACIFSQKKKGNKKRKRYPLSNIGNNLQQQPCGLSSLPKNVKEEKREWDSTFGSPVVPLEYGSKAKCKNINK